MKKDGGCAFPAWELNGQNKPEMTDFGMSKRFYAACTAMQGMLANSDWMRALSAVTKNKNVSLESGLTESAYGFADALLAEEERE